MPRNDGRLHFSSLKNIAVSPMHYKRALELPGGDTRPYIVGRATHRAWLCGEDTPVWTGRRDMRSPDYAAAVEQYGERLLNEKEAADVTGMVSALNRNPSAEYVRSLCTEFEKPLKFERSGFECAGRLGGRGEHTIIELKTCDSLKMHPKVFCWKASHLYHYPEQLSWYSLGDNMCDASLGRDIDWPDTYCVVVESSEPYDVIVYRLDRLLLDQAHARVDKWLELLRDCTRNNDWPGRAPGIIDWDADIEFGNDDEEAA